MESNFAFEVKELTAEGSFRGLASTYGNTDLVGDVIEPGAFTKTLSQGGAERILLWQHRDPIGKVSLKDSRDGLIAEGKLSLGVQLARDAHVLLQDRVGIKMSIGFSTIDYKYVGDIRHISEVKLYEVSLVAIPANPQAGIQEVKNMDELQRALASFRMDFERAISKPR